MQLLNLLAATPTLPKEKACEELERIDRNACGDSSGILTGIVQPIIETLILVIGAVSVLVIVVGGLMYVLSTGDPNNTKRAKDAILYAVIGLVVAIFAQAIVSFVIGRVA